MRGILHETVRMSDHTGY